jgi:hypothetical protein
MEDKAVGLYGMSMPYGNAEGNILYRVPLPFSQNNNVIEIIPHECKNNGIFLYGIPRSKQRSSPLEPPFCHGFYEDIDVITVIHMFMGKYNAIKMGRFKVLTRSADPHNRSRPWVYIKVCCLAFEPEASGSAQLLGGDKPRSACPEKLNKPFRYGFSLW